jgi:hypothetical protein
LDGSLKGDVLVTESTTEAFNILLPLLGGIVTDNGGLLSHAAIVSREYGIPGVVGTAKQLSALPTASLCASMGMPARSRYSGEKGRSPRQGARDLALRIEGRGAWRCRPPWSADPTGVALAATLSRPSRRETTRRSTRLRRPSRLAAPVCCPLVGDRRGQRGSKLRWATSHRT